MGNNDDSSADSSNSKVWAALSIVSALGAAQVTKKALNKSWEKATGKEPPANPADPDVDLWEAVAWAVVSGAIIAVARMAASRRAASYYVKSTGHLPPQLQEDNQRLRS